MQVKQNGKLKRGGALLWQIGTWSLKAELYANLRKDGLKEGAGENPAGYVCFSENIHDEAYFKQLTAEHLREIQVRGRTTHEWKPNGSNHYLDCRIYAMAMAAHRGLGIMTAQEWQAWVAARSRPPEPAQGDMLERVDTPLLSKAQEKMDEQPTTTRKKTRPRRPKHAGGFVSRGMG